jgi:hypothetical protein
MILCIYRFYTLYIMSGQKHTTTCFQAVCLGEGWVAVATSERTVRLFSVGGIQREMFSVAGPVVAMAGHTHQLLLTYHHAMGNYCSRTLHAFLLFLAM